MEKFDYFEKKNKNYQQKSYIEAKKKQVRKNNFYWYSRK